MSSIPCPAEHVINDWKHEFPQIAPPGHNNAFLNIINLLSPCKIAYLMDKLIAQVCVMCGICFKCLHTLV